jgi:hypothetical protein
MKLNESCTKLVEFCSSYYNEFKEDHESTFKTIENSWDHYNRKFNLMKGLVITPILTTTAAYLFNTSSPFVGTVFGIVNYATLFFAIEASREEIGMEKYIIPVTFLNGLMTQAVVNKVFHQQLNPQATIVLTIAAAVGQILRMFASSEHISSSKR